MATQTLWPALDSHGVSIPQLAEDGVTAITSAGIVVTLVQEVVGGALVLPEFYRDRVYVTGLLLTSDPLALSGDAVSVPAVTRVSASIVGSLTTSLAARPIVSDGEIVTTNGYSTAGDGGGATFVGVLGASSGADSYTKINTTNGQWAMLLNYGVTIDARQLGCFPDMSVDCGTILSAFIAAWLSAFGAGCFLSISVAPAQRSTSGGYKLSTGIKIPGQMTVTFFCDCPPYIDGLLWSVSHTSATRSGAVFVASANVTALSKTTPTDGTVPTVLMRNVGLLGPGGTATSGHGVDCKTGLVVTADGLRIAGFNVGYYARSVVSVHDVKKLKCTGCIDGLHIGAIGTNQEFVDGEFYGYDAEYNQQALVLENARDLYFYGGLIQGNYNGVVVGNAGGTHSIRGAHLGFNHYEANGDDASDGGGTPVTPWGTPGGKHLVLKAGGTIDTLHVCGSTAGGIVMPATTPRDITVPAGANVRFDRCFMSGLLTVSAGGYVEIISAARDGGFTGFSLDTNCVASWLSRGTNGGTLSGTYTHDWAASGPVLRRQLTGNVTISAVSNIPDGEIITFFFIQDATASRTVTWGASFVMDAWSNTGFAVAGSRSTISFMANAGGLMQISAQPSGKWLL